MMSEAIAATAAFLSQPAVQGTLIAAGTGAAVYGTIRAGKAQKAANEVAARQAKLSALDRSNQLRRRMIASLAAQNVNAAAAGGALEGSVANLMRVTDQQGELDIATSEFNSAARVDQLQRSGRNAYATSLINAVGLAAGGARALGQVGKPVKPDPEPEPA